MPGNAAPARVISLALVFPGFVFIHGFEHHVATAHLNNLAPVKPGALFGFCFGLRFHKFGHLCSPAR